MKRTFDSQGNMVPPNLSTEESMAQMRADWTLPVVITVVLGAVVSAITCLLCAVDPWLAGGFLWALFVIVVALGGRFYLFPRDQV